MLATLTDKPNGEAWSVGSAPGCDVVLRDEGVSALHAKIIRDGRQWKVIDEMSANGTFVNDQRANVSFIGAEDVVRFGTVECVFKLPESRRPSRGEERSTTAGRRRIAVLAALVIVVVGCIALFLVGRR